MAGEDRERVFIFAAAGFETTAPVYASLVSEALDQDIRNIRLLTALKTMPRAIEKVADGIDGFLAPGHVAVITGTGEYDDLASKLGLPFVVSGFRGEELISAIYALVKLAEKKKRVCINLYPQAVKTGGNPDAKAKLRRFFETGDAVWRGMGVIEGSGLYLKEEYLNYDAGSRGLDEDADNPGCKCAEVITGKIASEECPLFGTVCTMEHPCGACMVSHEGACFIAASETFGAVVQQDV